MTANGDMTGSTQSTTGPDFHCRVCGKDVDMAPADLTEQAVCEEHCPDHNYRYDKFERRHVCESCGKPAPEDFYYD